MNRRLINLGFNFRRLLGLSGVRALAVCFGVTTFSFGVSHYLSNTVQCEEQKMEKKFPLIVPRNKLKNELLRSLRPVGALKNFPIVYGVDGIGKTAMINNIINDLEVDAVYVDIPPNADEFDRILCSALGSNSAGSIESCILESTRTYLEKHHLPMILVLDSVENLARKSPASLKILLRVAKECVAAGTAKIVFVCNDSAVNLLQNDPLWSSADPIEVPELSELESTQYLVSRGVSPSVAKEAVLTITGGNLHLLRRFVECHVEGKQRLEAVRSDWFRELCDRLEEQQQLSLSNYELGLKLLSDKKSISVIEALDYFSQGDLKRLVDHKVLSYHSGAKFLKLRSKLVERYFGEKFGKT